MAEVEAHVAEFIRRSQKLIDVLNARTFNRERVFRPIPAGRDQNLGARRSHSVDFHVRVVHAQPGRVLTQAAALHRVRDHHHRGLRCQPIINRAEHKGLRAAAGFPRAGQPIVVHVRQGLQEVQRANAVPRLEPHQAHIPKQVNLVRRELAVPRVMLVRRRVGVIRKEGVIIAHHIVGKRDHALARKADAACGYAAVFVVRQPAFVPVPVRVEDGGERPLAPPERTIQVPREVKAGQGLEIDLLHAVTRAFNRAEDMRLERGSLGHRPQTATHEHLLANLFGARLPGFARVYFWELAWCVEVLYCRRLLCRARLRLSGQNGSFQANNAQAQGKCGRNKTPHNSVPRLACGLRKMGFTVARPPGN